MKTLDLIDILRSIDPIGDMEVTAEIVTHSFKFTTTNSTHWAKVKEENEKLKQLMATSNGMYDTNCSGCRGYGCAVCAYTGRP